MRWMPSARYTRDQRTVCPLSAAYPPRSRKLNARSSAMRRGRVVWCTFMRLGRYRVRGTASLPSPEQRVHSRRIHVTEVSTRLDGGRVAARDRAAGRNEPVHAHTRARPEAGDVEPVLP